MPHFNFDKVDQIQHHLDSHHYIAHRGLPTSLFLALKMKKPIFWKVKPELVKQKLEKSYQKI